jgi:hypothetical protein
MTVEPAIGMALYSARAVLHGRGDDVWEMVKETFSDRASSWLMIKAHGR